MKGYRQEKRKGELHMKTRQQQTRRQLFQIIRRLSDKNNKMQLELNAMRRVNRDYFALQHNAARDREAAVSKVHAVYNSEIASYRKNIERLTQQAAAGDRALAEIAYHATDALGSVQAFGTSSIVVHLTNFPALAVAGLAKMREFDRHQDEQTAKVDAQESDKSRKRE
jgi:hypothetical protein